MTSRGKSKREKRQFKWVNEDGLNGLIEVSWGPWGWSDKPAPIMVSYEDATWMDADKASEFADWLKATAAEARAKHASL